MHELPELGERDDVLSQRTGPLSGTLQAAAEVVQAGAVDTLAEDVARDGPREDVALQEG